MSFDSWQVTVCSWYRKSWLIGKQFLLEEVKAHALCDHDHLTLHESFRSTWSENVVLQLHTGCYKRTVRGGHTNQHMDVHASVPVAMTAHWGKWPSQCAYLRGTFLPKHCIYNHHLISKNAFDPKHAFLVHACDYVSILYIKTLIISVCVCHYTADVIFNSGLFNCLNMSSGSHWINKHANIDPLNAHLDTVIFYMRAFELSCPSAYGYTCA